VQDLFLFAHVSGNVNPLMLPSAEGSPEKSQPVAPSMWVGSLISAVLGNLLPGPGTLYRAQDLRFLRRVHVGDKLKVTVVCREKREEPAAVFDTRIEDARGQIVCEGTAEVDAPTVTQVIEARELPALIVDGADHFAPLIARAAKLPPLKTAVVCPEDHNSLGGALLSATNGLIEPILVGDPARIGAPAKGLGADISAFALVAVSDPHAAAARAVGMVLEGKASAVMKGAIHSDALLAEVVKKDGGLRTHVRVSHVFAMDVPTLDEILFISDAAINIAPDPHQGRHGA
jgi:phosphate butyryltransferase